MQKIPTGWRILHRANNQLGLGGSLLLLQAYLVLAFICDGPLVLHIYFPILKNEPDPICHDLQQAEEQLSL